MKEEQQFTLNDNENLNSQVKQLEEKVIKAERELRTQESEKQKLQQNFNKEIQRIK